MHPSWVLLALGAVLAATTTVTSTQPPCSAVPDLSTPNCPVLGDGLRKLLDEDLPDSEFQALMKAFVAKAPDFETPLPDYPYADPYTALDLYDRCVSLYDQGAGVPVDIVQALIQFVNPVVFGAVLRSMPQNNAGLRSVLALMPSSALQIPEVPQDVTTALSELTTEFPAVIPHHLDSELVTQIRTGLAALFGEPYAGIFPNNELFSNLLLIKFKEPPVFVVWEATGILTALVGRGIRLNARNDPHGVSWRGSRLFWTGNTVPDLFHMVLRHTDTFRQIPELRRRLARVLALPVAEFPWPEFFTFFSTSGKADQPRNPSLVCGVVLNLVARAYRQGHAEFAEYLLPLATSFGHPDRADLLEAARAFVACKFANAAEFEAFLQNAAFSEMEPLETFFDLLELDPHSFSVRNLYRDYIRDPAVVQALRTQRLPLLVRVLEATLGLAHSYALDSLHLFTDLPEVVAVLDRYLGQYVATLGSSFNLDGGLDYLLTAVKLPIWPRMVNCPSTDSFNCRTLLHFACEVGNTGAVRLLVADANIDICQTDRDGLGPVYYCLLHALRPYVDMGKFEIFMEKLPMGNGDFYPRIVADFREIQRRQSPERFLQIRAFLQNYAGRFAEVLTKVQADLVPATDPTQ